LTGEGRKFRASFCRSADHDHWCRDDC
jgi:hypothetical protein